MNITKTAINFIREPLLAPFGFKGGHLDELWQILVRVEDGNDFGIGVGVQSVLWSDAEIFASHSQCGGNTLMFLITEYALTKINGKSFETPFDVLDYVRKDAIAYAKKITGREDLRETFVMNALVALDNAMWQLYAKQRKCEDFTMLVPETYRSALSHRHNKLCNIPLITYGLSDEKIHELLKDGFFLLKIKIGSDPDGDKDLDKMLAWDKARLAQIHKIASGYTTEFTDSGRIAYYIDANGRYDTIERMQSFLDYAKEIGALEQIVLLEEPFAEQNKIDVSSLPCRIAADESAHSVKDVEERIALGYTAIALKPIAKTMSESLRILNEAAKKNVVCFCADLTVNPLMVEINKNVAARIAPIPGIKIGAVESNGAQNYTNWEKLYSYHPMGSERFAAPKNGVYELNDKFFETAGGIYRDSEYYINAI
ncbi:MAG: mandelate racemase/muconate lactonizing enzyme family protein [Oscillospiraceae bacterium]|nr:mandelate racemase/muconate lactonizing enzyme family protein [Oscillospiraceae bacterium]